MKNLTAACLLSLAASAGAVTIQMPPGCTTPDGMTIDPKGRFVIAAPNTKHDQPGAIYRIDAPGAEQQYRADADVHDEEGRRVQDGGESSLGDGDRGLVVHGLTRTSVLRLLPSKRPDHTHAGEHLAHHEGDMVKPLLNG